MADVVNQSTLKQVVVPAAAAAVVVLLIGLLVYGSSFAEKPGDKAAAKADGKVRVPVADLTDTGMTDFAAAPPEGDPAWQNLDSGLKYQDVAPGEGEEICPKDAEVTIHYSGWLTDGTPFDSSRPRNKPNTFKLGGLIKGWQIGIPGMKKGGIRRLLIPSALGYGAGGSPPKIPGGATLVFEIKLLGFEG